MNTIEISKQDNYAILRLKRGRANPINFEMLEEIQHAYNDFENDDEIKGVLLSGQAGFFSAGLDIIELADYDRETMSKFWMLLANTLKRMALFYKPVVTAITGHCPAGGCVLANTTDYRVMAHGKYRIGLNEVPVGIILPEFIYQNYAFWVGKSNAYQYVMEGKLHSVDEALENHLIDAATELENVESMALEKLKMYMQFNANVWSNTKKNLKTELAAHYNNVTPKDFAASLDQWFDPGTQAIIQAMVKKLKG